MSRKAAATISPNRTARTARQEDGGSISEDARAGHNGHPLTLCEQWTNHLRPVSPNAPQSIYELWYCQKDDIFFIDADSADVAPTVINSAPGTSAYDFRQAAERKGQRLTYLGRIGNATKPVIDQDPRGQVPSVVEGYYNQDTNTLFLDNLSTS